MDAEHTEILAKIAIPLRELVNHLQGAVDSARQVSQSVDSALKAPDVQATPWTVKFRHASRGVNIAEAKMVKPPTPGMQLEIHDEASGLDLMYEVTEVKSEPHRLKVRCMVRGPIELPPEAVPPEAVPQDTSHPAAAGSPLDESVAKAISKKKPAGPLYAPYVPGALSKPMTDKEMGEIGQFDSSDQSHE